VAAVVALAAVAAAPVAVAGQADPATDTNVLFPIEYIEQRLQAPELDIVELDRSRPLEADRARRVVLAGRDGESPMQVHWKPVAPPGYGFNNEPRYELAAYRFQKMFLAEEEYVVPPTALRAMPIDEYQDVQAFRHPTIRGTRSVLFLLSYWIQNLSVDTVDPYRPEMFELNRSYHHHFANANLLTHLIDHKDGNHGNLLVSRDGLNMRVFAVDNDVAFRSDVSDRGDRWRRLLGHGWASSRSSVQLQHGRWPGPLQRRIRLLDHGILSIDVDLGLAEHAGMHPLLPGMAPSMTRFAACARSPSPSAMAVAGTATTSTSVRVGAREMSVLL
jgi:hypothetical protein